MRFAKIEQETVIIYNREEPIATVTTYDPALIRKLDAMGRIDTAVQVLQRGNGWTIYKLPKKWVKVIKQRVLTDEKRAELSARAKAMNEKRKGEENHAE